MSIYIGLLLCAIYIIYYIRGYISVYIKKRKKLFVYWVSYKANDICIIWKWEIYYNRIVIVIYWVGICQIDIYYLLNKNNNSVWIGLQSLVGHWREHRVKKFLIYIRFNFWEIAGVLFEKLLCLMISFLVGSKSVFLWCCITNSRFVGIYRVCI